MTEAIQLSVKNALVVNIGSTGSARRTFGCLYGLERDGNLQYVLVPTRVSTVATLQVLASGLLIFLFLLAVRKSAAAEVARLSQAPYRERVLGGSDHAQKRLPIGTRPVPGTLLKRFAVYILTNRPRGVLYVGMSSDLAERIRQHREELPDSLAPAGLGFRDDGWVGDDGVGVSAAPASLRRGRRCR